MKPPDAPEDPSAFESSDLAELWAGSDDASPDPSAHPHRRRRVAIGLTITLVILALLIGSPLVYINWATNAALPAATVDYRLPRTPTATALEVSLPDRSISAVRVTGGEEFLGEDGISAEDGADEARPIASITKLITALVILDRYPLDSADDPGPTITFSKADHDLYDEYYVRDATIARMPTGSTMSLNDALATMLIPSASNYADAVSRWAFGSPAGFRYAAQQWLTEHDLSDTTITDATGLSASNTSTPADLLTIGALAAQEPAIVAIVSRSEMDLPGPGTMWNTNTLLGSDGITGLKTGNLGRGNFTFLYTADLDVGLAEPLTVTGAILDGYSRAAVNGGVLSTLDSIRSGFQRIPLVAGGDTVGTVTTPWGETASVVISTDASLLVWSDTPIEMTSDIVEAESFADGDVLGTLTWTAGPRTATATIEVDGTIAPPSTWWRLTHPSELG